MPPSPCRRRRCEGGPEEASQGDAEEARLEALPREHKADRIAEAKWFLPPSGCFFQTEDVTQLEGERQEAKLHVRHFMPKDPAAIRGTVFYFHGIHGHCNTRPMVDYLVQLASNNMAVVAIDMPGHGYSEGEPMLYRDMEDVFEVLESFLSLVMGKGERGEQAAAEADLKILPEALAAIRARPFFVMGESLGGLFSCVLSANLGQSPLAENFRGTIMLAPALAVDLPPAPVTWLLKNVIGPNVPKRCMPGFLSKSASLKAYHMFKDPLHIAMCIFDNKPMPEYGWDGTPGGLSWRHGIRWSTALAVLDVLGELEETIARTDFPYLILHDPGDVVTPFPGTQHMMRVSPSSDKTLIEMPGDLHGLTFNCPERVVGHVMEWISKRL